MIGKEPRGELARYAFGYSDRKPGLAFWLILAGMVVYVLFNTITIVPAHSREGCLTRREARREFPGEYLSWRGRHCWYSPAAERKAERLTEKRAEEKRAVLTDPAPALPSPVNPEPPEPLSGATPLLTGEALLQAYINRKLAEPPAEPPVRVVLPPTAPPPQPEPKLRAPIAPTWVAFVPFALFAGLWLVLYVMRPRLRLWLAERRAQIKDIGDTTRGRIHQA